MNRETVAKCQVVGPTLPQAFRLVALAVVTASSAPCSAAQQDEIQVYADEINKPGEFTLQMHVNATPKGVTSPNYAGEYLTNHGVRISPEFAYGVTKDFEIGAYVPEYAVDAAGHVLYAASKIRFKWLPIQPDEKLGGFYAGANVELTAANPHIFQPRYQAELRNILGYRSPEWLLAINPTFDWQLESGYGHANPDFNYSIKLTRKIAEGFDIGAEYYSDIGPLSQTYSWNAQDNRIYGVIDIDMKPVVLNLGVGYGLTAAADKWTVKAIFDVPLK